LLIGQACSEGGEHDVTVSAANTGLQRTPGLAPSCVLRPSSIRLFKPL
jgi:hypothetical protein